MAALSYGNWNQVSAPNSSNLYVAMANASGNQPSIAGEAGALFDEYRQSKKDAMTRAQTANLNTLAVEGAQAAQEGGLPAFQNALSNFDIGDLSSRNLIDGQKALEIQAQNRGTAVNTSSENLLSQAAADYTNQLSTNRAALDAATTNNPAFSKFVIKDPNSGVYTVDQSQMTQPGFSQFARQAADSGYVFTKPSFEAKRETESSLRDLGFKSNEIQEAVARLDQARTNMTSLDANQQAQVQQLIAASPEIQALDIENQVATQRYESLMQSSGYNPTQLEAASSGYNDFNTWIKERIGDTNEGDALKALDRKMGSKSFQVRDADGKVRSVPYASLTPTQKIFIAEGARTSGEGIIWNSDPEVSGYDEAVQDFINNFESGIIPEAAVINNRSAATEKFLKDQAAYQTKKSQIGSAITNKYSAEQGLQNMPNNSRILRQALQNFTFSNSTPQFGGNGGSAPTNAPNNSPQPAGVSSVPNSVPNQLFTTSTASIGQPDVDVPFASVTGVDNVPYPLDQEADIETGIRNALRRQQAQASMDAMDAVKSGAPTNIYGNVDIPNQLRSILNDIAPNQNDFSAGEIREIQGNPVLQNALIRYSQQSTPALKSLLQERDLDTDLKGLIRKILDRR